MNYINQKCQICNAKLLEGDDVVICPECGAPYHRECFNKAGHCVYEEKHTEGFEFKPENNSADNDSEKICLRCGSDNPSYATECRVCGYPTLQDKKQNREYYKKYDDAERKTEDPADGFFGAGIFNGTSALGIDPMGGVPKNAVIDGEAAVDVATVVGQNTPYYMPRFKKMSDEKKKVNWNWVAFFLPHFWFFLRKCYLQGVAALMTLVATLLVWDFSGSRIIELLGISYRSDLRAGDIMNALDAAMQDPELAPKIMRLTFMSFAAFLVLIAVNVVWGLFANYIYKQHTLDVVCKKNEEAKENGLSDNERVMLLGRSGGTNIVLALIVLLFTTNFVAFVYQLII